jgi:hypothetical protein
MTTGRTTSNQEEGLRNTLSEELSVKEVADRIKAGFRYLASKWLFIFIAAFLGGLIGAAYSYLKKPLYKASTNFVLDDGDKVGGLSQYAGLASIVGMDVGGGGSGGIFQGDNIFELYRSRKMVQKALLSSVSYNNKQELLIDRYLTIKKSRENWKKPELKKINFSLNREGTFSRLQDSVIAKVVEDIDKNFLTVSKPDKKLNIIQIDVNAPEETFAKDFNDQLVKMVNDFYVQTKTKKANDNLLILQHQTDSVKNVLNGALYQSVAIADATPNLNITRQILRAPAQRSQFNAEANKAILVQLVQNLELAKISLRKETPLIQVIDTPIYPLPIEKLSAVKGIVIGIFLASFFSAVFLVIRKVFVKLLS